MQLQIKNARWLGVLFLAAFLLYGIGRNLFENDLANKQYIGATLIVINSMVVIVIGLLLRKTIVQYSRRAGNFYLISRAIEAIGLASILLSLVAGINISLDLGYFIAMLSLGLGSIPMCYVFFKHAVIPAWLSIWGLLGYILLAFGFLLELVGIEWSMYFLILGGLWEITFSVCLIIKGSSAE